MSDGIEAEKLDIYQQILLVALHWNFMEEISNELKNLQEKDWVVIVLCAPGRCLNKSWLPDHRIFRYDYWTGREKKRNIRRITITNLIDVLKNPLFNRVELAMRIKLENFDKSCFSKQRGDIVIHLMIHMYNDPITLLRNAIITVSQFPNHEVKFVFYSYSMFNDGLDFKFYRRFTMNYGINSRIISFERLHWFNFVVIMDKKKDVVSSTKRNFFLILPTSRDRFLKSICSATPSKIKDVHFYSSSFHDDPLYQCDGKRSPNIHETVDLYDENHFMNTINDLACEKSNDKKDEL